jgi:chromate transporter
MDLDSRAARTWEVFQVFGRLGLTAFGGPAVHVAMMRREVVERRGWLDQDQFAELFAACNLIPGPGSTQMALVLGRRRAGWTGIGAAALGFITPAVVLLTVLGELYRRFGSGHLAGSLLLGAQAAVVGMVAAAAIDLGRKVVIDAGLVAAALLGLTLGVALNSPLLGLAAGGLVVVGWRATQRSSHGRPGMALVLGGSGHLAGSSALPSLALTFLKIGAVAFGSGYVLLPLLHSQLVGGSFGLTDRQLADAFAVGQAAPGPVFACSAFLGDLIAGVPGALASAAAIFAPSLIFVVLLGPIVQLVRRFELVRDALAGVAAAAVGVIASVILSLGRASIVGLPEALVAVAALLLLWRRPTAQPLAILLGLIVGAILAIS